MSGDGMVAQSVELRSEQLGRLRSDHPLLQSKVDRHSKEPLWVLDLLELLVPKTSPL